MPECKTCESYFIKYPLEISGWNAKVKEELPSSYHNTPTCPNCGLIGDVKKTKLKDALVAIKARIDDPEIIMDFMVFYRKRNKDFADGYSVAMAFISRIQGGV